MTKSRTLRKAGAVVLSLAMAFSVAGVAPSADAAAKKPALSAKKGTIKVGKTKKVTIKNTTKKKVKKLVVSSSNKKVATVKKNNKVKFTVTGKTAGTAKITAKVTLKKAVAKKKVYKLKYTATVKKATTPTTAPEATATPGELKLEKVESAGRIGGSVNILVAYFTSAMSDINPADIQIRRVSDDRLFTVEKVVMGSDKKSATLTLTGTAAAAVGTDYLVPNVDYKLIVTAGTKILEKAFTVPRVAGEATVYGVDATNKRINVVELDNAGAVTNNLNVPADITVDYQDILGKTVTVEYDKTNTITKLNYLESDKVVFGAFKLTNADQGLTDLATGTKYTLRAGTGTQVATQACERRAKGATGAIGGAAGAYANWALAAVDNNTYIAWAKLTVNAANVVKFAQVEQTFDGGFIKVGSVTNDVVINGKTQINLKDFTILKDGKTIKTTDLAAGDVVAYSPADAFAEVLPAANTTTGALTAVHDMSITYNSKTYKMAGNDANIVFATKYSKKDAAEGTVDNTYLDSLMAAKKDVTVTLNRANQVIYLDGDQAAAKTSTKTLILTDNAKAYTQSLVNYVRLKGFDGEAVNTYDVDMANVTKITGCSGKTFESGKDGVNGFEFTAPNAQGETSILKTKGAVHDILDGVDTTVDSVIDKMVCAGELVTLTLNDKNVVTEVNFKDAGTGSNRWVANGTDAPYNTADAGKDATKSGGAKGADDIFKAGFATLDGKQISKTTPLYIYDDVAAAKTATKTTYGEMSGEVANGKLNLVYAYSADGSNISNVVVKKSAFGASSSQDEKEGIIAGISYSTAGKVDGFKILVGKDYVEATEYADISKATPAYKVGDIVTAQFKKDTTRLEGIKGSSDATGAAKGGILSLIDAAENTFYADDDVTKTYKVATTDSVTPTIAKFSADGSTVEVATLAEVITAAESKKVSFSTVSTATGGTLPVDAIIVNGADLTKTKTTGDYGVNANKLCQKATTAGNAAITNATTAAWGAYKSAVAAAERALTLYVGLDQNYAKGDLANYAAYNTMVNTTLNEDALKAAKTAVANLDTSVAQDNSGTAGKSAGDTGTPTSDLVSSVVAANLVKSAVVSVTLPDNTKTEAAVTYTFVDGTTATKTFKVTNALDSTACTQGADATLAATWTKKV